MTLSRWSDRLARAGDALWCDARLALRSARRAPGFIVLAALSVGAGIAVTTAGFGLVDVALFRPLPYADPARLVLLSHGIRTTGVTYAHLPGPLFEVAHRHPGIEALGAFRPAYLTVREGRAERWTGFEVDSRLLGVLGLVPERGRLFTASEYASAADVVLISDALWRGRFGGNAAILGAALHFEGRTLDVIGVMPPGMLMPGWRHARSPDFLLPTAMSDADPINDNVFGPIARLRRGTSTEAFRVQLDGLVATVAGRDPRVPAGSYVRVEPLQSAIFEDRQSSLMLAVAAPFALLLLACVNLANLLVARQRRRTAHLVVQAAVGASRLRLARPLVFEALGIVGMGGAIGLAVGVWMLGVLGPWMEVVAGTPPAARADLRVVAFALGLSLVTGIVVSLVPVWEAARFDVRAALNGQGSRRRRARGRYALVAVEVGLAVVLVTGAALMLQTLANYARVDPGFDTRHIIVFRPMLPVQGYSAARGARFWQGLANASTVGFGGRRAAVAYAVPLTGDPLWGSLWPGSGSRDDSSQGWIFPVSAGYFEVLGLTMKQGRTFTSGEEAEGAAVGVVNESAARQLWPGLSPIGRRYQTLWFPRPHTIVGVVADVRTAPGIAPLPALYVPFPYGRARARAVIVKIDSDRDFASAASALVAEARRLEPWAIVPRAERLDDEIARQYAEPRLQGQVLALFALLGLSIAAVGIGGVVGYSVALRSKELAVRAALGATPGGIERLVLREVVVSSAVGATCGLVAAHWASRALRHLLFGIEPGDLRTLAMALVVLLIVAAGGALWPARLAGRVDPSVVLRRN